MKIKIISFIFLFFLEQFGTYCQTTAISNAPKTKKITGAVLFTKILNIDGNLFLKSLNNNWSINAKIISSTGNKFSFEAEGFRVEVALKNKSFPAQKINNCNFQNILWPDVIKASLKNKAYYDLSIEVEEKYFFEANKLFSKVCSILLGTKEAISACNMVNQLLIPKEFYIRETLVLQRDVLPLRNWLTIRSITKGIYTNSFTLGLEPFGFRELEIINSKKDVAFNENVIYNVASFVLEQNTILKNNERLNITGDASYMVYNSDGVHVPKVSVKVVVQ
jgi:Domain of unknown function (DUF4261)